MHDVIDLGLSGELAEKIGNHLVVRDMVEPDVTMSVVLEEALLDYFAQNPLCSSCEGSICGQCVATDRPGFEP